MTTPGLIEETCKHPRRTISWTSDHPGAERWYCADCGMTGIQPVECMASNAVLATHLEAEGK